MQVLVSIWHVPCPHRADVLHRHILAKDHLFILNSVTEESIHIPLAKGSLRLPVKANRAPTGDDGS